jgi:Domain of unknown function (DUF4376)
MVFVIQQDRGYARITDPTVTLTSLDGETRAPMQAILAPAFSAKERAQYGVFNAAPFTVPVGKMTVDGTERFELDGEIVRQVFDVVDTPGPTSEDVNRERDRRVVSGFTYLGALFQSRVEDQKRINGAGTLALVAVVNGAQAGDYRWHGGAEDFAWISEDNQLVRMDAFDVIGFGQAAARWESLHVFAARALKDAVPIPADFAADAYWPANV